MFRYSLRTLGAAVAAVSVAFAALMRPTPTVANVVCTLLFMTLSLGTVVAIVRERKGRGFWSGFCIVGWLYLLVGVGPLSGFYNGTLLTTQALHWAADELHDSKDSAKARFEAIAWEYALIELSDPGSQPYIGRRREIQTFAKPLAEAKSSFIHIGQSLCTLLLALLGGWIGAFILARRPEAKAESCC